MSKMAIRQAKRTTKSGGYETSEAALTPSPSNGARRRHRRRQNKAKKSSDEATAKGKH